MNTNIIGKILSLPEDIIREVASYFIQKISHLFSFKTPILLGKK